MFRRRMQKRTVPETTSAQTESKRSRTSEEDHRDKPLPPEDPTNYAEVLHRIDPQYREIYIENWRHSIRTHTLACKSSTCYNLHVLPGALTLRISSGPSSMTSLSPFASTSGLVSF